MTAPLTPADCDLRAMTFMPIDIIRLFGSEFHALSTDAEWRAGLTLWLKSWHQVPAASLPNDDIQLARHAELGRDLKTWKKVKAGALRGWVECEDGRLYHPVVADKALDAWERRGEWQEREENKKTRQQRWRDRCKALSERLREAGIAPPRGASLETLESLCARLDVDGDVDAPPSTRASHVDGVEIGKTGTGTGTGTVSTVPDGTGGEPPDDDDDGGDLDPLAELRALPIAKGCWRLAVKVLVEQGRLSDPKARSLVGKLKGMGLADDELWQIAEAAWREQTEAPQPYLVKAAEGVIARRGDFDPMLQPEPWRQQRWMAEFVEGRFAWAPQRGPGPGEVGCRVSPEIQREFGVEPASPQPVRGAA